MARRGLGFLSRVLQHRALARWTVAAREAPLAELSDLRHDRAEARALRQRLDEVIVIAESRLALPRIGSGTFPLPPGTDWSWRPALWRGPLARKGVAGVRNKTPIGEEVTVFHDCRLAELTLRQTRNTSAEDLAPFAVSMDVFRFQGTFLSLAIDLPDDACHGLKKRHLVRVELHVETEKPLEIFGRLNVRHGPNTEQIVRELPRHDRDRTIEFDLAYTRLNEKRVEAMWIDLIFERPEMNQVTIRDLTFARYPRAEM